MTLVGDPEICCRKRRNIKSILMTESQELGKCNAISIHYKVERMEETGNDESLLVVKISKYTLCYPVSYRGHWPHQFRWNLMLHLLFNILDFSFHSFFEDQRSDSTIMN